MSSTKKPNWFWLALRNALVSQAVGLVVAASGGAGALIGTLGYFQGWPWAQIVTYALVGAAAAAALIGYARKLLVTSNLLNQFYVFDITVTQELNSRGDEITGYALWAVFKNRADIPICYRMDDLNGSLGGMALRELPKPEMYIGRVEALQDQWHSLGVISMRPPENAWLAGTVKLNISFGKNTHYAYDYKKRFDLHVLLDEAGNVQRSLAFHR